MFLFPYFYFQICTLKLLEKDIIKGLMACSSIRLYKENEIYLQFHPTLNFKTNRENKVKQIKNRS